VFRIDHPDRDPGIVKGSGRLDRGFSQRVVRREALESSVADAYDSCAATS
jgi:hypothetical protein